MPKKISLGEEIRKSVAEGSRIVSEAVTTTLGPRASNVLLEKPFGRPIGTHDGVTVAKEIALDDQFQNLGAQLVIEAAEKTNKNAGDGTTTAVLLAHEILTGSFKQINNGENSQIIKRQLKDACQKVVAEMERYAVPVKGRTGMQNVAQISSGNKEIGYLVALAYEKVGENGIVRVDVGTSKENEMEFREGFIVPKGLIAPHFVTDIETLRAEMEDVSVLVTEDDVSSVADVLEILKQVSEQDNKKILIIAENVSGAALILLIQNRQLGNLKPIAIQAPRGGDVKKGMLEDIAVFTGATFLSQAAGNPVKSATLASLGRASKVISDREETVIIGGKGKSKAVSERIAMLKKMIKDSKGDFEKEGLEERLSKLTGKVAVIYAGGSSETEIKEQRFRIEDAINATKAAIEEGIVPGGGSTLYRARKVLPEKGNIGERILRGALEKITLKILENAGVVKPHLVTDKIESDTTTTFDVMDIGPDGLPKFGAAMELGVVDPLKVLRSALENAVSVAGELITTGAGIVEIKEEPAGPQRPPQPPRGV